MGRRSKLRIECAGKFVKLAIRMRRWLWVGCLVQRDEEKKHRRIQKKARGLKGAFQAIHQGGGIGKDKAKTPHETERTSSFK